MIKVTAGIIVRDGKFLIARRGQGKHLEGCWEFPGGKVEDGESPEDCLDRELREELSIDVEVLGYITENVHAYPEKTIKLIAYLVKYLGGEFKLTSHDRIQWVNFDEVESYVLAPADIPILKDYAKQRTNRKSNCL